MISLRWGAFDIDRMTDNRNMQLTVVSSRPELGGIVPILLENPESRLDFNRDKNIPIVYTNDQSFSQELPYDPIRRTFLAPGGRRAHPAHPPPPTLPVPTGLASRQLRQTGQGFCHTNAR